MQGGHAGKKIEQILSTMQVLCFCVTKIRAQAILPSQKKIIMARKIAQPPRKNNGPALSKQFNKRTQWKSQP